MIYPTISEYIESIKYPEDNFATLTNLRPILDDDGNPIMSSGNFAVVFKMQDRQTKKKYAVKCFLREQMGRAEAYRMIAEELENISSTFLTHFKYFEKELFVGSNTSDETEFSVLLMDWIAGVTLDKYLREHIDDCYELSMLAYQFSRLAMWLMPQPFAHGDLKPDNILVRDNGTLVLVDYDGMYVPAMKGQKARELGSPDFRHPKRTELDFDEHIDDFALTSIALQLYAIANKPSLFESKILDSLLLTENDHRDIFHSEMQNRLCSLLSIQEFERLYALYLLAHSMYNLDATSYNAFNIAMPKASCIQEMYSTNVTQEDLAEACTDEFGVKYSSDYKRLLKAYLLSGEYNIPNGTLVICDEAFCEFSDFNDFDYVLSHGESLINVTIPSSVKLIGNRAFSSCESLKTIILPHSITNIGNSTFNGCYSLSRVLLPASIYEIGDMAFRDCKSLVSIVLPSFLTKIGCWAFAGCESLANITIPSSVIEIGTQAFDKCSSLANIYIPHGTKAHFKKLLDLNLQNLLVELPI